MNDRSLSRLWRVLVASVGVLAVGCGSADTEESEYSESDAELAPHEELRVQKRMTDDWRGCGSVEIDGVTYPCYLQNDGICDCG